MRGPSRRGSPLRRRFGGRSFSRLGGRGGLVATMLAVVLVMPSSARPTLPGRHGLTALVTHTYGTGLGNGIAVVRPDGSRLRKLTRNVRDRSPAWSPDGTRLAFERAGQIYAIGVDGRGLRQLTRRPAGNGEPAWSPDSRSIAFTRRGALLVMRADGTRQRRLFHARTGAAGRPSWSPDGKWIAFGLSEDGPGGSIAVISPAGGAMRYLTDGRLEPTDDAQPGDWADDYG